MLIQRLEINKILITNLSNQMILQETILYKLFCKAADDSSAAFFYFVKRASHGKSILRKGKEVGIGWQMFGNWQVILGSKILIQVEQFQVERSIFIPHRPHPALLHAEKRSLPKANSYTHLFKPSLAIKLGLNINYRIASATPFGVCLGIYSQLKSPLSEIKQA